jgi:c-di-GMP-binding flagellar brake protein YcgR
MSGAGPFRPLSREGDPANLFLPGKRVREGLGVRERRVSIRRRADREFLELVEKKTGLKPEQSLVRAKRRRVIRHLCKVELSLDVAAGLGEEGAAPPKSIEGRVLDLSEGGASVFTEYELTPGHPCHVKLKLIDGETIESRGEIRWAERKDARDGYAVGIRFVEMNAQSTRRLGEFLTRLDATLGL